MKKIKLTNKQIIKLCEMCDKLFDHTLSIQEFQGFTYIEVEGTGEEIHWFEFCFTFLLDKLSILREELTYEEVKNKDIGYLDGTLATYLQIEVIQGNNPVDYLYSEFKKLKL
jgi:hypothetical protein